ncbi:hypothetical protein [Sphingomonas phyllosphaerae]|uniref:hypothetical protein n=1 Tax=Sphingomonas phyllosphaerae TaxID=257003 RepID=UPI0003F77264|nr:hypothetical protein [Sphingomonas phyllosphaerae]
MKRGGRPLRFLVLVFGAWIGLRTWQLWPDPPVPEMFRQVVRRSATLRDPPRTVIVSRSTSDVAPAPSAPPNQQAVAALRFAAGSAAADVVASAAQVDPAEKERASSAYTLGLLGMVRYGTPAPPASGARRWSASGWAMLRESGAGGGVATPQLGGSQAGIRIARTLDQASRLALVARVAAALDTRQQEAALGLDWQPTALPVRIVAERRIGLANQRGGTAIGLVGGATDRPLPGGLRLDGYAQAGALIRDRVEGYADGALHLTRQVVSRGGRTTIALGLGLWGGAQRDAGRLDIGPAATLDLPVGSASHLRLAVEWRQRIVGDARPASGPALSIGTDY